MALVMFAVPSFGADWSKQTSPVLAAQYEDAGRTLVFSCGTDGRFAASLIIPPSELPDALRGQSQLQVVFAKDESAAGQVVTRADVTTVDGKIQLNVSDPVAVKAALDLGLGAAQHLDIGIASAAQANAPVTAAATVPVAGLGGAVVPLVTPCAASAPPAPVGPSAWTTGGGSAPSSSAPQAAPSSSSPGASSSEAAPGGTDDSDDMDDMDDSEDDDLGPPVDPFKADAWSVVSGDDAIDGSIDAGITNKDGVILQLVCAKGGLVLEYLMPDDVLHSALAKADKVSIVFQFDPVNGTAPTSWATVPLDHDDLSGVYVGRPASDHWADRIASASRSISVGLTLGDPGGNFTEYNVGSFPAKGSSKAIADLRAGCK